MLLGLLLSLSLAQAAAVTGTVKDATGGIVSGASIVVRTDSGTDQQTVSGPDGRFSVEVPDGQATLVVRAGGFAEAQQPLPRSGDIEVVLKPASLNETVTVTPTRTEQLLGNTPASISVLDSDDIKMSPAVVADDVLSASPRSVCSAARAAFPRTPRPKACRFVALGQAEPAARWCWSTTCRSTIRSAPGSTGRAFPWKASIALRL